MPEKKIGVVVSAKNKASRAFKSIEKDLDSVKKKTEAWNKKFENTFDSLKKGGAVLSGIGVGLGMVAKSWVDVAASAEETQSKFDVVFKGMNKEMNDWSKSFASDVGRSQKEIKGFTSGLGDILKPLGFATDGAADMSKQMVELALDVASFNDKQDADVIRAFTSALTGERESLKSLGIVISEADVKQEAYNSGLAKQGEELSKTAKAQATMNLLFKNTADAQGDLARTSDSYTNSQKAMTAAILDMKVGLGEELLPIVTPFIQKITSLVRGFGELSPGIRKVIALVTLATAAFALIGGPILLFIGFLPQIVAGLAMVSTAFAVLTGPIGLIIAAVAALAFAWSRDFGGIKTKTMELVDTIKGLFDRLNIDTGATMSFIKDVVTNTFQVLAIAIELAVSGIVATIQFMTGDWKGALETMSSGSLSIFKDLGEFLGGWLFDVVEKVKAFFGSFSEAWKSGLGSIKSFFVSTWDSIVSYFSGVLDKVLSIVAKIKSATKKISQPLTDAGNALGGKIYDLTHPTERAFGGSFDGGKPMLVGERGPEIVTFPSSGKVIPNNKIAEGAGGGGMNVHLHISGNNFESESQFRRYLEMAKEMLVTEVEIQNAGSFAG